MVCLVTESLWKSVCPLTIHPSLIGAFLGKFVTALVHPIQPLRFGGCGSFQRLFSLEVKIGLGFRKIDFKD